MKIVITVPGHLTSVGRVGAALERLRLLAGGCTVCHAYGNWVDPHGNDVREPVEQHHFCFVGPSADHDWGLIDYHLHAVCLALFEAGEQAVLVERSGRSYHVNLFTQENFQ